MRVPLIVYVAVGIPLLLPLIGLLRGALRSPVGRWLVAWGTAMTVLSVFSLWLRRHNNMWSEHVAVPIDIALLTGLFAAIFASERARVIARGVMLSSLALILLLLLTVENVNRFPAYTGTIRTILVSGGAGWALITLTIARSRPLWRDAYRLIAMGVLINFMANLMFEVAFRFVVAEHPELAMRIITLRAGLMIIGYTTMAMGLYWIRNTLPSGSAPLPLQYSSSAS